MSYRNFVNMKQNSNSKIKPWQAILLMASLFTIAIGWLFTVNARLDNKVDEYKAEVSGYREDISEIDEKLGIMKNDILWIKGFLDPFGEYGSNPYDDYNYEE